MSNSNSDCEAGVGENVPMSPHLSVRDRTQELREAATERFNANPCRCRGRVDRARADSEFTYLTTTCPRCGALLLKATQNVTMSPPRNTGNDLRQMKEDAMVKVLGMSGIAVNSNTWRDWRPTKVVRGVIAGIDQTVVCYATDGNLAIFNSSDATTNLGTWFVGHVRDFEWERDGRKAKGCPPSLFAKDGAPQVRKAGKKKKTRVEKLAELLGL